MPDSNQKIAKPLYQMMSIKDKENHPYQLVLVYASHNCQFTELVEDLKELLDPNITTIITGDFNFDKEVNALTKFLGQKNFTQIVNWPTHKQGRRLDHCYVSYNARVQVSRHSPYYSDHDALCIEFEHFPWC